MAEQVSAVLGIELGAGEAITQSETLFKALDKVVTAEDAVVAASKAVTAALLASAAAAKADAAQARAQESARRDAQQAARQSAAEIGRAAATQQRAEKDAAKAVKEKSDAEAAAVAKAERLAEAEARAAIAAEKEARSMALVEINARKMNEAFEASARKTADMAAAKEKAGTAVGFLSSQFGQLTIAAIGFKAIQYAKDAIQLADAYTNVRSRLGLVATGTAELDQVQAKLFRSSQDTSTSFESNVALYTSMFRATRSLGTSQDDLLKINKAVANSFRISGAATSESAAATRQLGQALASGVLRGDEFNSIAENAPRLQQAVADSLHVTIGELRAMAADGKITAAVVTNALKESADAINEEAKKIAPTYESASQQASNALLLLIGKINDASGFTRGLAGEVKSFADYAESLANDKDLINYWHNVGLGAGLVKTAFNDTGKAVGGLAEITLGSLHNAYAVITNDTEAFERVAKVLNVTLADLRHSYDDTVKLFEKPVQKSVLGFSDFGSNPKPLAPPAPKTATKEEIEAQQKLNEAYKKSAASAQLELDKQRELTAAHGADKRVIDDINDKYALKNDLAGIDAKLSNTQKAALTELIINKHSLLRADIEATRATEDEQKARDVAFKEVGSHFAFEVGWAQLRVKHQEQQTAKINETTAAFGRYAKGAVDAAQASRENVGAVPSHEWVAEAEKTLSIVQEIASTLDTSGHLFSEVLLSAASTFGQIAVGVNSAGKLKSDASFIDKLGAVGQIVGAGYTGIKKIQSLYDEADERAYRAAEAQRAYNKELEGFALIRDNSTQGKITANAQASYELSRKKGNEVPFSDSAEFRWILDQMPRQLRESLETLYLITLANEEDIKRRASEALRDFKTSNDAIEARLHGNNELADSLTTQLEIQGKVNDAIEKYGNTTEILRYQTLLQAEAEKKLSEQREKEAKRLDRSLFDSSNSVQGFFDPRGANESAFLEGLKRRVEDAETPIEKLAAQAYAAAAQLDYFAKRLDADTRTSEGFVSRVLGTLGNDRTTQDYTRAASQRNELTDLRNSGASLENIGLARFTHQVENSFVQMQRAVEDGTKAINTRAQKEIDDNLALIKLIQDVSASVVKKLEGQITNEKERLKAELKAYDDQITTIRDNTKAQLDKLDEQIKGQQQAAQYAQQYLAVAEKQLAESQRAADALNNASKGFALSDASTLSPTQRAAEARRQFEEQSALARGGNRDAATNLPAVADAFLKASRNVNASNTNYGADASLVQGTLGDLAKQFNGLVTSETVARNQAQASLDAAQSSVEYLQQLKENVSASAERQIAALEGLKDVASTTSQATLDLLQQQIDDEKANAQNQIDKLTQLNEVVRKAADEQIAQLVANEQAAHNDRVRAFPMFSYYESLRTGDPTSAIVNIPPVAVSAPTPGESQIVSQLSTQNQVLSQQLAQSQAQTNALKILVESLDAKFNALTEQMNIRAQREDFSDAETRRILQEAK